MKIVQRTLAKLKICEQKLPERRQIVVSVSTYRLSEVDQEALRYNLERANPTSDLDEVILVHS
jgi:hypothetical protein